MDDFISSCLQDEAKLKNWFFKEHDCSIFLRVVIIQNHLDMYCMCVISMSTLARHVTQGKVQLGGDGEEGNTFHENSKL